MKKPTALLLVVVVLAAAFVVYAWRQDGRGAIDASPSPGPLALSGTPVERGRYLADAADCVACHTAPGGEAYAGGLAFRLPFGTIYSSNLTPDPAAGIGGWSDEDFLKAVRSGVGRGGRHLYPAHPYTSYAGMAREDVLAIKAYLGTLPPVTAKVPDSDLRFPFSQRGLMPLWNAAYFNGARFRPDAGHDAAWNRGAYLATALGHCGECHTPRNFAFALRQGHALQGAVTRGWKAYDITASGAGIGAWTEAELNDYLASGHATGHGAAAGPMREVVAFSTSRLTADDRAALVSYLLSGRAANDTATVPASASTAATPSATGMGATLYAGACAGCHALDPAGAGNSVVDLRGARSVRDPEATNVLKILSEGSPHGTSDAVAMPAFGRGYSDTERAALANFVLAQWGGITPSKTPNDARRAREAD